jgi:hypothetical protein
MTINGFIFWINISQLASSLWLWIGQIGKKGKKRGCPEIGAQETKNPAR